jgi:hypothetical protein
VKKNQPVRFGFGFISLKPKKLNRTEPKPKKTEPNRKKIKPNRAKQKKSSQTEKTKPK